MVSRLIALNSVHTRSITSLGKCAGHAQTHTQLFHFDTNCARKFFSSFIQNYSANELEFYYKQSAVEILMKMGRADRNRNGFKLI